MKKVKLTEEVIKNKGKNSSKLLSEEGHSTKKERLCLKTLPILKKESKQILTCTRATFTINPTKKRL